MTTVIRAENITAFRKTLEARGVGRALVVQPGQLRNLKGIESLRSISSLPNLHQQLTDFIKSRFGIEVDDILCDGEGKVAILAAANPSFMERIRNSGGNLEVLEHKVVWEMENKRQGKLYLLRNTGNIAIASLPPQIINQKPPPAEQIISPPAPTPQLIERRDINRLKTLLRSKDDRFRYTVLDILKKVGGPEDLPQIRRIAFGGLPGELKALSVLGKFGNAKDLSELILRCKRERFTERSEYFQRALCEIASREGRLFELLDINRALKRNALEAIANLGSAADAPFFRDLINDGDRDLALIAIAFLGKFGNPADLQLLKAKLQDSDRRLRLAVAEAAINLGEPVLGLQSLKDILQSKEAIFQQEALKAMARANQKIDQREAREAILTMLSDESDLVRRSAVEAFIAYMTSPDDLIVLEPIISNPQEDNLVRETACEAYVKFGRGRDLPFLRKMEASLGGSAVHEIAARAIAEIVKREGLITVLLTNKSLTFTVAGAFASAAGPENIAALRKIFDNPQLYSLGVLEALGRFADQEDLSRFENKWKNGNDGERIIAAEVLYRMGQTKGKLAFLKRFLLTKENDWDARPASQAIVKIFADSKRLNKLVDWVIETKNFELLNAFNDYLEKMNNG